MLLEVRIVQTRYNQVKDMVYTAVKMPCFSLVSCDRTIVIYGLIQLLQKKTRHAG
jgi:hypothetical protein